MDSRRLAGGQNRASRYLGVPALRLEASVPFGRDASAPCLSVAGFRATAVIRRNSWRRALSNAARLRADWGVCDMSELWLGPELGQAKGAAWPAVLNATDSHPVAASPPARRLSESDLQQVADLVIS